MIKAKVKCKSKREEWYNLCKSLYLHSTNTLHNKCSHEVCNNECSHFKCKKILKKMPEWWEENVEDMISLGKIYHEYFVEDDKEGIKMGKLTRIYKEGLILKHRI